MIPKTMRVGAVRTSIKLEPEFWDYLTEVARARRLHLTTLVNEAAPGRASLASALRVFALTHARQAAKAGGERLPADTSIP